MPVNILMLAACLNFGTTATAWGRKAMADLKSSHAPLKRKTGRILPLFALGFSIFGVHSISADPHFNGFRRVVANASDGGGVAVEADVVASRATGSSARLQFLGQRVPELPLAQWCLR